MERPKVGVGVMVINGDKVLVGKRKGSHGAGTWAFPGGHLEAGESFKDCALREVAEEVGINVEVIDEIPFTITNDIFVEEDKHYITPFIRVRYLSGEVRNLEPEKCDGWVWFTQEEVKQLNLFTTMKNLIKQEKPWI